MMSWAAHALEQLNELLGEGVEVLAEDLRQVLQLLFDAEYLLLLAVHADMRQ
jgi:hypothetical protein